jgi:hypothetical protein
LVGSPKFTSVFELQVQTSTSSRLPTTCPRPSIGADPALGLLHRQGAVQVHQPDEAVANGSAVQAAILSGEGSEKAKAAFVVSALLSCTHCSS